MRGSQSNEGLWLVTQGFGRVAVGTQGIGGSPEALVGLLGVWETTEGER